MNTIMFDMSDNPDAELIQKAFEMGYHVELRGVHDPFDENEFNLAFGSLDTGSDPFAI